jgi:hypothetical protein
MVKIFYYNNERSAGNDVKALIEAKGCTIKYLAPGLLEINGPAERSGGMIVRTVRALLNDIDLPRNLWLEAIFIAIYLLNRVLIKLDN